MLIGQFPLFAHASATPRARPAQRWAGQLLADQASAADTTAQQGSGLLRPIPIRRYLAVMQARAFPARSVLRGTRIDAQALEDPKYLIEADQYLRVIENMIGLTGGEGLGLDIGLQRDVKDFGVLGYAALSSGSVRQAVEEFWGRYGESLGMLSKVSVPRGDARLITLDILAAALSPQIYRFFVEEALCLLLKVGAQVSGVATKFVRLELSYPEPGYMKRYEKIFDCPARFNARRTRVTLHRSWFEMPLQTSNPELIDLYRRHLDQLKQQIDVNIAPGDRLRHLFVQSQGRLPNLEQAARSLNLSPRTLRRRLHDQGQSFGGLLAEHRLKSACALLAAGSAAAQEIAVQIGFEDVNAFRRAFKKWTGQSVNEYRERPALPRR